MEYLMGMKHLGVWLLMIVLFREQPIPGIFGILGFVLPITQQNLGWQYHP